MRIPGFNTLEEAFLYCRDMDASLNERLEAFSDATRYLIPGILAAGQPGGIFGAFKTLKTSITADLLISLASGTPFLGQFDVAEPGRALFLSGESGLAALQSIAGRICSTSLSEP